MQTKPTPLTTPSAGNELCYECDGLRACIYCGGRGKFADETPCSSCYGRGLCGVCNGAGELPEGTRRASTGNP
jgi:hypothetical protein